MSLSVRPQFSQIILIPALRAAGIAVFTKHFAALFPAPSAGRLRDVEMKKFCISMITRAVLDGEMIIGVVVVASVIEELGDGRGKSGGAGRVRSKDAGETVYSQWLGHVPTSARGGFGLKALSRIFCSVVVVMLKISSSNPACALNLNSRMVSASFDT